MTAEPLAKAKGSTGRADELHHLATAANGLGVTRVAREQAAAELERQAGKRGAARLKESALRAAGARPKGLMSRLFS